ncbi:MAG: PhzF family phenazine biosynthesis protein [Lewinella sp.]
MPSSKRIPVQIISAFAEDNQGGNPAGVVLDADDLSTEQKQQIARKVGLSETAFISRSDSADYRIDFFTPNKQIAHCGHATIAAFSYLKQQGILTTEESSKETIDGNRQIKLTKELAFMEQTAPTYTEVKDQLESILTSLRLESSQLVTDLPVQVVNTGNAFLIIPVTSSQVLTQLSPDFDRIGEISEQLGLIGYYVFTTDTEREDLDATTRMFAPHYGIREESGTGMAAGPLACYLRDVAKIKKARFKIQQGKFMEKASKSLIIVDLDQQNDKINSLMVGGKGIVKEKITVELDD